VNQEGRPTADVDGDCIVGLGDYTHFADCVSASGPAGTAGWEDCLDFFDADTDLDVDLADFLAFQSVFTGR
jgi:hypothetical protein